MRFTKQSLILLFWVLLPWASKAFYIVPDSLILPPGDSLLMQLPNFVVTAQRQKMRQFSVPRTATQVISGDMIRPSAYAVPELLRSAPGVFMQKTNHGGGSPIIRGLTGQQVLVLNDGIRLNNATFRSGPNQYLNTLDPGWLSGAEVLEGGGSVEYGSDALGGVVNLQTHTPQFSEKRQISPELTLRYATGNMEKSVHTALNASGKRLAFRGTFALHDFGDLLAGRGLGRLSPTGYRQHAFSFKTLFEITPNATLTVAWQQLEQKNVPIYHKVQLENFARNHIAPQQRQLAYLRLNTRSDNRWIRQTEWTISNQYLGEVRESQKNGDTSFVREKDDTRTLGLTATITSILSEKWTVNTGAEYYFDRVYSKKTTENLRTNSLTEQRGLYPNNATLGNLGLFHLHTLQWSRLTITGGLRYHQTAARVYDDANGRTNLNMNALVGHAGASVALVRRVRLFSNCSTAFRAPNIDDLGTLGIVDFRYEVPNSRLRSEQGRNVEAGLKIETKKTFIALSAYHLQLKDLIERIKTTDSIQGYPVYQKENTARAFIRGGTVQVRWMPAARLMLLGHATYTFGANAKTAEPLRRIPPVFGRICADYQITNWLSTRLDGQWAGAQYRLSKADVADNRIADDGTPGWAIAHWSVTGRFRRWALSAEWHNLTNAPYRVHGSGVDGTGSSLWLQLRYN
jgi:hemoglobin/transferrin/lactoferrin receptor protein